MTFDTKWSNNLDDLTQQSCCEKLRYFALNPYLGKSSPIFSRSISIFCAPHPGSEPADFEASPSPLRPKNPMLGELGILVGSTWNLVNMI